jgi:formate hydrogenlyase subunit 3/multisubunit Na+/H+ antiporter MnhD subunit
VISHATAKAAMFMAAGLIFAAYGHDRVADLKGIARALPMTVWAFALSGIALIGLPPAGGFLAKWLLLSAALSTGQWWWVVVLVVGGLLTAGYVFPVLARALASGDAAPVRAAVPRSRQAVVLALAVVSTLAGFAALAPVDLVQAGRAAMAASVGGPR